MSAQMTIEVSDQVALQAARIAALSRRRRQDVLAEWLERAVAELPVEALTDDEVLALADLQLSEEQQTLLSDLLQCNREGTIDAARQRQLDELMRVYERGLLRKSQALREAVKRGLKEPLSA